MDLTVLIALVALGLGIANTAVQVAVLRRERTSVVVTGGAGYQVYPNVDPDEPETAWITATNAGRHPVTIEAMHFVTDRGQMVVMMESRLGDPARVLQPGEPHTASNLKANIEPCLRPGEHLVRAVAEGPGGRRWTGPVYGDLAPARPRRRLPFG